MFTKATFVLTFVLVTASGALAAAKSHSAYDANNVYNPAGAYLGADPDANVRFELKRDWDRGN